MIATRSCSSTGPPGDLLRTFRAAASLAVASGLACSNPITTRSRSAVVNPDEEGRLNALANRSDATRPEPSRGAPANKDWL